MPYLQSPSPLLPSVYGDTSATTEAIGDAHVDLLVTASKAPFLLISVLDLIL